MKTNKKTASRSGLLKIKNSSGQFMLSFILIIAILAALWFITAAIITATAIDYAQDVICNLPEWEGQVGDSQFVGTTGPDAYNDTIYVGWRISKMIEAAIGFPFEGTRDGITQGILSRVVEIAQSQQTGDPAIHQLGDDIDPASGSDKWPWIPNNSVYVISCTKTGDRWSFHNLAYRQCAPGEIGEAGQEGESLLVCRPVTPNPAGKYYPCTGNVCTETNCAAETCTAAETNAEGCSLDTKDTACGAASKDCSDPAVREEGCKNVFSELECGQPNIPTNVELCKTQGWDGSTPEKPVISCSGGPIGLLCSADLHPDTFCAGEAGCQPPGFFACEIGIETGNTLNLDGNYANTDAARNCTDGQDTVTKKYGVKCPNAEDVCDIENKTCIDPKSPLPKYDFDVEEQTDNGMGINFKPTINADYYVPQICVPDQGVYCPECKPTNPNGEDALVLRYNQFSSKGGTVHFTMANRNLVGQTNYALILYKDWQQQDTESAVKQEMFVAKINAGETGGCQSETPGISGPVIVKPVMLEYNWDWNHIGPDYCSTHVCDATQFTLVILQRLKNVQDTLKAVQFINPATVDFNAWLMPDGYNLDFRKDFDRYYKSDVLLGTPASYTTASDSLSKFVLDYNRLKFDPPLISRLANYHVTIDIRTGLSSSNQLFNADNNADANITVIFNYRTQGALDLSNVLYYLPFDGEVGSEAGNTREGYGVGFSGEGICLNNRNGQCVTTLDANVVSDRNSVNVSLYDTFSETNQDNAAISRRGQVLQIERKTDGTGYTLAFSPTTATPVAIKITAKDGEANGHFQVVPNANVVGQNTITTWTELAGSYRPDTQDLICSNFDNQIMSKSTRENDLIDLSSAKSGFAYTVGSNVDAGKQVVLGGVFYVPTDQASGTNPNTQPMQIQKIEGDLGLITPNAVALNTPVSLNFTETIPPQSNLQNGFKIHSLQDVINLLNNDSKALCVYSDSSKTIVYWNRNQLINELQSRNSSAFGANTKVADLTSLIGGHYSDWACNQIS
ncbi:MAG: hypothetical protein V1777_01385 [Candidatus Micrarchaeota archaeon]